MNNLLITGSTSYLGKYIVKNQIETRFYSFGYKNHNKDVEIINNISKLKELKIDTLLHFANFKSGDTFLEKEEKIFLEKLIQGGVQNIIYSNTYWCGISQYNSLDYVVHKKNIEEHLLSLSKNSTLSVCSMMLGDVYGANDHRNKLIPYLLKNEELETIKLENNPNAEICLINIHDIFQFIKFYKFKKGFKRVDLIGEKKKLFDVVKVFKKSRNRNFDVIFGNKPYFSLIYDSSSSETIKNLITLEEGFKNL